MNTKPRAILLSVVAVLAVVSVSYSPVPVGADNADIESTISFADQPIGSDGEVDTTVSLEGGNNATVLITYNDGSSSRFVGINTINNAVSGESGTATIPVVVDQNELASKFTAYLYNTSTLTATETSLSSGDVVSSELTNSSLDSSTAQISRTANTNAVFNSSWVFQGEDDLVFYDDNGNTLNPGTLEKTAGDARGTVLQMPISEDASTGTYAENGNIDGNYRVTVVEPRITTAEVQLDGVATEQVVATRATPNELSINATWNFAAAEDIEVTVEDPSGTDVTSRVVSDRILSGGTNSTGLDLSNEDPGEYTIIFEGADNLDQNTVVQEYTIETTEDTLGLEAGIAEQGESLGYTITGATNNAQYLVTISSANFSDGITTTQASQIFASSDDTVETGVANETSTQGSTIEDVDYAYALVRADGSTGSGSINTEYLNSAPVEIDLFAAGEGPEGETTTDPVRTTTRNLNPRDPVYNATISNDGSVYTLGFPGPIEGTLNDVFPEGTEGVGAVYQFDSESDQWKQVTDFSHTPEQLTAIAIVTDGEGPLQIPVQINIKEGIAVPGDRSLATGWNLISASTYDRPESVFSRGTTQQSLLVDSFSGPTLKNAQTTTTFRAQSGSSVYEFEGQNQPMMSPFKGYFVYITQEGSQPAVLINVNSKQESDTALNVSSV